MALRYLGFGAPTAVPADEQGRLRFDALAEVESSRVVYETGA